MVGVTVIVVALVDYDGVCFVASRCRWGRYAVIGCAGSGSLGVTKCWW